MRGGVGATATAPNTPPQSGAGAACEASERSEWRSRAATDRRRPTHARSKKSLSDADWGREVGKPDATTELSA